MSLGTIFLSELFGTAMLALLGCGVVANVALKETKGNNGGFLMVTWGWGIAVFVRVSSQQNPAPTSTRPSRWACSSTVGTNSFPASRSISCRPSPISAVN
jgi:hypothetical protein